MERKLYTLLGQLNEVACESFKSYMEVECPLLAYWVTLVQHREELRRVEVKTEMKLVTLREYFTKALTDTHLNSADSSLENMELKAENEALRAKLQSQEALKAEVAALKARNATLEDAMARLDGAIEPVPVPVPVPVPESRSRQRLEWDKALENSLE